MKVWNLLFLFSILSLSLATTLNVTELTDGNFTEFVKSHENTFVYFYANICEHCMQYLPVFDKLAAHSKENEIPFTFARIDANINYNTREKYGVTYYPTMMAFIKGEPVLFRGDQESPKEILEFLLFKAEVVVKVLKTKNDLLEVIGSRGYRTILIADDKDTIAEYEKSALLSSTKAKFFRTSQALGKTVIPDAAPFPSVVLYKDYDERKVIYRPNLGRKTLKSVLKREMYPTLTNLSLPLVDAMLGSDAVKKGVVLFTKRGDNQTEAVFKTLREAIHKRDLMFLVSHYDELDNATFKEQFNLVPEDMPALVIIYREEGSVKRFLYKGKMDLTSLLTFFKQWEAGTVPRSYKSEAAPLKTEGPVYRMVGVTFQKEVLEEPKDVMVKFYAPWCPHCQDLAPIYIEVAKMFPKVKFVEIDSTKNEVEGHDMNGFPTVKFFPATDKANPIVVHSWKKDDLIKFMKEKLGLDPVPIPVEAPKNATAPATGTTKTEGEKKPQVEPRVLSDSAAAGAPKKADL